MSFPFHSRHEPTSSTTILKGRFFIVAIPKLITSTFNDWMVLLTRHLISKFPRRDQLTSHHRLQTPHHVTNQSITKFSLFLDVSKVMGYYLLNHISPCNCCRDSYYIFIIINCFKLIQYV